MEPVELSAYCSRNYSDRTQATVLRNLRRNRADEPETAAVPAAEELSTGSAERRLEHVRTGTGTSSTAQRFFCRPSRRG